MSERCRHVDAVFERATDGALAGVRCRDCGDLIWRASAPRAAETIEDPDPPTAEQLDSIEHACRHGLLIGPADSDAIVGVILGLIAEVRRLRRPRQEPARVFTIVRREPARGAGPVEEVQEPPLTDDELLALVDGCETDEHRWLAYRALSEIQEMRRQLARER